MEVKMLDYYPAGFGKLKSDILDKGLCTGCSICTVMCRLENIVFDERPVMKQECASCQLCTIVCPRAGEISSKLQNEWDILNRHALVQSAQSTDKGILKVCQDGGVTTSLLWYALDKGLINGAVVSGVKDLKPVPMVATTYEELVSSAGVRYSPSPTYQALLPFTMNRNSNGFQHRARLGLVGTPCQVLALRNMQLPDLEGAVLEPADSIDFTIGLFCMEQFNDELTKHLRKKMDLQDAKKFKITRSGLEINFSNGSKITVEHDEIDMFVRYNCRFCMDFASMYADISVGNAGSPPGWTTVIIRSDIGRKIYHGALNGGYIVENPKSPNMAVIERMSNKKKNREKNLRNVLIN
ncbi:MAG: Coenzyme F420 hydrogenase/dehydrogenase, beta subunit C-terminal domain [Candidatus Methanoperedens sp.]|nr:Coenzyme F420 hydrogenase/dehydrogenase, beta subunit C-terminal domain [Candidatus Methanoperedens sp.]